MKIAIMAAKALGFTNAISKLSKEERLQYPSARMGEDYNILLRHVANECPDITDLLPPPTTFTENNFGERVSAANYGDLYTFSEQIYQMLNALKD